MGLINLSINKITNNYFLLLISLKITHDGNVTYKPSKSPKTPFPLMGGVRKLNFPPLITSHQGRGTSLRYLLSNWSWPVGLPRTMKIDLFTVGAALCGRLIEEPTEGLPYIY